MTIRATRPETKQHMQVKVGKFITGHLSSSKPLHWDSQDIVVVYRTGFLIYKDKAGTYVIRAGCDHPDLYQP